MAHPVQTDPTKVIGRRVLATLIDAALVLVPSVLLVTSSLEYHTETTLQSRGLTGTEFCDDYLDAQGGFCFDLTDVDDRVYFTDGAPGSSSLVYWGLSFGLLVVLQGLTGWTIGKLVTGIRTVRADGRPPGLLKALARWLLWVVDGFPYVAPLVGFITALTTVGHRRVGDMAAGTYVVRASAAGSPVVVPGLTAPPPPPGYVSGVPWGTTTPPPPSPGGAWGTPSPGSGWGEPTPNSGWGEPTAAPGWGEPTAAPGGAGRGAEGSTPARDAGEPPATEGGRDPYADWQAPGTSGEAREPAERTEAGAGGAGWATGATASSPAPAAPPPQWDEARGTYIQWDPSQGAWLQWEEPSRRWIKIPGQ